MQSETPDRAPSGPDDDTHSQANKRRRTSDRSTRTTQDLESLNAPPMGRRTLTTSSPQRGSSRDMTPPESAGSIKYTRTGRVSKATKGQRVHHCDECGKVGSYGMMSHHLITRTIPTWHHRTMKHSSMSQPMSRSHSRRSLSKATGSNCVAPDHRHTPKLSW